MVRRGGHRLVQLLGVGELQEIMTGESHVATPGHTPILYAGTDVAGRTQHDCPLLSCSAPDVGSAPVDRLDGFVAYYPGVVPGW